VRRRMIELFTIAIASVLLPCAALAFDSGSTGVDGDLGPAVNTEIQLPADGVLNFRRVNIPWGVTVRFKPNATNTPVTMLVAEDADIAGSIDLTGEAAPLSGGPGKGAPGGFDGGFGGLPTSAGRGGDGLGPGGGGGAEPAYGNAPGGGQPAPYLSPGGGGAGHATTGLIGNSYAARGAGAPGATYGSHLLLPLVGGSGGGGGAQKRTGGPVRQGVGGSGGGGALLLAAKGTVTVTGAIIASGGNAAGDYSGGGAGSGGAVRIVATSINMSGAGTIHANGGAGSSGGRGGEGRIRLEAENALSLNFTSPDFSFGSPGPLFVPTHPALRFSMVAGIPVPANPTGFGDLTVPATTGNPVSVVLATSGVPVGTTIKVRVTPQFAPPISVDSPPTTGSIGSATTSLSLDIPFGHNVLSAETTYTVIASVGDSLSRFAEGERVEKVTLTSTLGGASQATLHTATGRAFPIEPALLALAALPH